MAVIRIYGDFNQVDAKGRVVLSYADDTKSERVELREGLRVIVWDEELEAEGRVLTYSADTGPSPVVGALADGADLFLCENTLPPGEEGRAVEVGHLSARQAAQIAVQADARRLLLTHFFAPAGDYAEEAKAAAAKEFGGQILIAKELHTYEV